MYPNLYYALLDLFGWELPALKLINSFGLFVALAFLAAHGLLGRELKRHAALGNFKAQTSTEVVGHAPNPIDLAIQALMGFVLGWKVLYLVVNAGTLFQGSGLPQAHLFSTEGNVLWGVLGAIAWRAGGIGKSSEPNSPNPKPWSETSDLKNS